MYKHKSYTFYDQRDVYLNNTKFIKLNKLIIYFLKNIFGNKGKCFIHNKYMNSKF